jgi:hypothetical protein
MLTRKELKNKINECINDKISFKELSRWAVFQMDVEYEPGYDDLIHDIVYDLELSDNKGFELDKNDLKEFVKKLS